MSFYGAYFIYDNIISSDFGLKISSIDGNSSNHSGANVTLHTESLYGRSKVYLMGVEETPTLNIPISIMVENELTSTEASIVSRWLFGQKYYKKLKIVQPDMQYVYYNCIFINPSIIRVGNIIRGFEAEMSCDSPFAWEYPFQKTYYYGPNYYSIDEIVPYDNHSDSSNYIYPIVEITTNRFGGEFSVINITDNNREFSFTGLSGNETLTIDNDLQIIVTTESHLNRIENFNGYNWFRLLPKLNRLHLIGNIDKFRIINQAPKKVS